MGKITGDGFINLARPAMLWLAVFVNVVYTLVVSLLMLSGKVTFGEVSGFLIVQLGAVTAPATTFVFMRSQEKKAEEQAKVDIAAGTGSGGSTTVVADRATVNNTQR